VSSAYIERVLQLTAGARVVKTARDYTFRSGLGCEPSAEGRQAILDRYCWSDDNFDDFLAELQSVHTLGARHALPMLQCICDRDTDGPQSIYNEPDDGAGLGAGHTKPDPTPEVDSPPIASIDEEKVEAPQVTVTFSNKTLVLQVWTVAAAKQFSGAPADSTALLNGKPTLDVAQLQDGDHVELRLMLKGGSRVARGENILKQLGASVGTTPAGLCWDLCAIDPMHDRAVECRGYPDTSNNASVPQRYKQSATIAAPPGLTTGNFDAYVVSCPWKVGTGLVASQLQANLGYIVGNTTVDFGIRRSRHHHSAHWHPRVTSASDNCDKHGVRHTAFAANRAVNQFPRLRIGV
jgi:hypothetical protein